MKWPHSSDEVLDVYESLSLTQKENCCEQEQVQNDDSYVVVHLVEANIWDVETQSCHVHLVNKIEYLWEWFCCFLSYHEKYSVSMYLATLLPY